MITDTAVAQLVMTLSQQYFVGAADFHVSLQPMDSAGNACEAGRVGQAVEQTEPKQQECRRHATEEKILQGGFGGARTAFVEGGKDVERQAQKFKGDKNDQEILRSHQEHHASRCDQDEQDKLANVFRKSRIHRN